MPYDVFLPEFFKRIVKDLKKKYPSVTEDLKPVLRLVASNPGLGKALQGFGDIMKLRVKNSDIGKGKSGGYRLIYLVDQDGPKGIPLLIYSKSQKEDVTSKELKALLSKLDQEIANSPPRTHRGHAKLEGSIRHGYAKVTVRHSEKLSSTFRVVGFPSQT